MPSDRDIIYLYIYIYHHGNYKNANLSAPITMRTVKTQKNCVWFIGRRMAWNEMGSVYQQSKHVLWMIFGSNTLEDVEGFCATNIIFWMRILSDEENGRGGGGRHRKRIVTLILWWSGPTCCKLTVLVVSTNEELGGTFKAEAAIFLAFSSFVCLDIEHEPKIFKNIFTL